MHTLPMRGLAVLALLSAFVPVGWGQDKLPLPKPLPDNVVKQWTQADSYVSWVRVTHYGQMVFRYPEEKAEPGDTPAFRFRSYREGVLPKLPMIAEPFGVSFANIRLTDAGLAELAGFKNIQALDLRDTLVTDEGLKSLAGLTNLQSLGLERTKVTAPGLKVVGGLKNLRTLTLRETKTGDAGMKELAGLKHLQSLNLSLTRLTDTELKELVGLQELRWLNIGLTPVTDAGVKELAKLQNLEELLLPPLVTDAGLKELASLKKLRVLHIANNTRVTKAGRAELQKALPNCYIN